jgi:predicted permease
MEVGGDALASGLRARLDERGAGRWTMGMGSEIGGSLRSLRRSPGFVGAVVATLGLGIGSATAVYSIADWMVVRPVPGVRGQDRIVTVRFQHEERGQSWFLVSHPDFLDLRDRAAALEHFTALHRTEAHLLLPGAVEPIRVPAEVTTDDYFATLGVELELGRVADPSGGRDPRQVVVSHRLWSGPLRGDADVLGSTLTLNGQPFVIVGVAPPDFHGPAPTEHRTELWVPAEAHGSVLPTYPTDILSARDRTLYFTALGRLRDGATVEQAEAQLRAAREALVEAYGAAGSLDHFVPVVEKGVGVSPWTRERARTTLGILLAAVGALLALGCANAGNLLLARASTRVHDVAVRRALGAARGRIVATLLGEGLLLAVAGGAVGLGTAKVVLLAFGRSRLLQWLPDLASVEIDGRVILFALGTSLVTGLLFSLAPAVSVARRSDLLLPGERRVAPRRSRVGLRRLLLTAQVALSLSLLVGAGLMLLTVRGLGDVRLGFEPADVLEATVDPGTQGYGPDERTSFWRELLPRARALAGVEAAGLAAVPLHGRIGSDGSARPAGTPEEGAVSTWTNQVSDGFLAAVGIELVAGRDFLPSEVTAEPAPDVVIVSRGLARELFGTGPEQVVGRELELAYRPEGRTFEVVGVVDDVRVGGVRDDGAQLLLEPLGQPWNPGWATLYARGRVPGLAGRLRGAIRALDPSLPLYDVQPLQRRVDATFQEERLLARLTTFFASLALLLSGVGLYGVLSFTVTSRRREMGIRLALGARGGSVRTLMLRRGLALTLPGVPLGLALAALLGRLMESRLWGVEALDPRVYAAAAATLLGAAVIASWMPAWRATRIDPAAAVRAEG